MLACLLGCSLMGRQRHVEIVEMHSSADLFENVTKEKVKLERRIMLVYDAQYRLFVVPVKRHRPSLDSDGKPIMGKLIHDTVYTAYAFIENGKKGLQYDILTASLGSPVEFNVDSIVERLLFKKNSYQIFNQELGKPTQEVKSGNTVVEKYLKKKVDIQDADSILRYYDRDLKDLKFTFSPQLDSVKKSKLYKMMWIFNPIAKGVVSPDFAVPRREMFYEFRRIENTNPVDYKRVLDRFRADYKTELAAETKK